MSANERVLVEKLKALPPDRLAEVEDFVDFLAAKSKKLAALDRLLAIAPALEAAGVAPMTEEEIDAEVKAARAERRARMQTTPTKGSNADRP
jgi:hypothetical protein